MNLNILWQILILIAFFFCSCENQTEKYIKKWYNKNIHIPNDLSFYQWGTDSVNYEFQDSPYKMLVLLDTVACISCQLRLDDWKRFITDMDSVSQGKITYLFAVHPVSKRELHIELKNEEFNLPVCLDDANFRKINDIPTKGTHVFLLNQMNRIICVGNPIANRKIKDLYKRIFKNSYYEN